MEKKKRKFIERTEGDDILDALSLRVNETLKTEKKIDDKKNNVYFWLFKFLLLILYLIGVNVLFSLVETLVIDLIYYFGVSLRSVFSLGWSVVLNFTRWFVILYTLFKNLTIFMNSTYYRRLYSKDKEMNDKKKKFFSVCIGILKILSVPLLIFSCFVAAISLSFFTMLVYLALHGAYSVSSVLIVLCTFAICYSVFKNIQRKFFDIGKGVSKKSFAIMLVVFLFSLVLFSYETGSYEYDDKLPKNFVVEEKILYFDIKNRDEIMLQTGSKYDNLHVYIDNNLDDEIRVEFEYFETADVRYTYYFNEDDDLNIKFESAIKFEVDDFESVLKLVVETIRNQTMYNYNLFKYPTIRIYANHENIEKVTLLNYKGEKETFLEE